MEIFRVGEAVLRSHTCLPFMAPSTYGRVQAQTRTINAVMSRSRAHCQAPRSFSMTCAVKQDLRESQEVSGARAPSRGADDMSSILDSALDYEKGTSTTPATRSSRFKSSTTKPSNPTSRQAGAYRPKPGSSVDELFEALKTPSAAVARHPRVQSGARGGGISGSMGTTINSMLDPSNRNILRSPTSSGPPAPTFVEKTLPMKLGPSVGRTVAVNMDRGMDVGRAFRSLEIQCARNSVRRDFMRQRFHERPGLKRKRLASERWRRRFKENFKGVVKMVQKMRAQGW